MDLDPQLLELLRCPKTRVPLRAADDATVQALNAAITAGTLVDQAGQPIKDTLDAALVTEDDTIAYAVRDAVPQLIIEDGIALDQLA